MSRGSRMHPGNDVEHHGPWGPFPRTVKLGAGGWSGRKLEAHCLFGGLLLLPSDITIEMGKGLAFLPGVTLTTEEYGKRMGEGGERN